MIQRDMRQLLAAMALCLTAGMGLFTAAYAQNAPMENPDWKEVDVPPPPAFNVNKLVQISMPQGSGLTFGVDPDTVSVGSDSVVRYVLVATSKTGAVNAMYEGIRCGSAEVKTYARNSGDKWNIAQDPDWRPLRDGSAISAPALAVARQGGCVGHSVPRTSQDLVRALRSSMQYKD